MAMTDFRPRIHLALRPDAGIALPEALSATKAAGFDGAELSLPSLGVVIGGRIRADALTRLGRAVAASGLDSTLHAPLSSTYVPDHADLHIAVRGRACGSRRRSRFRAGGSSRLDLPGPVIAVGGRADAARGGASVRTRRRGRGPGPAHRP
jgi:hypothetical protein